jgi:hypothetical protein
MILGMEIALIVVGLIGLVTGKLPLDKTHSVHGLPARFLGLVALTPIPLSALAIAAYLAVNAPATDPAAVNQFVADNQLNMVVIEAAIVIGAAVVVFGLGRLFAGTAEAEVETVKPVRWQDRVRPADEVDDAVKKWLNARTGKAAADDAVPLVRVKQ